MPEPLRLSLALGRYSHTAALLDGAITPEGAVFPCSHARHSDYHMGNLLADEIGRLWSGGPGHSACQAYIRECRGVRCACRIGTEEH